MSSCKRTNQEKEIIIENRIINPVIHRIEVKQLLNVDKIGVYDTLSVFINRGTDSIFICMTLRILPIKELVVV